jgi:predicted transcriptional regulator
MILKELFFMSNTTTIRISLEIYSELKKIAEAENKTMQKIIEQALEEFKKMKFFTHLNETVASYKADANNWSEEIEERAIWDNTLADDLEDTENETW